MNKEIKPLLRYHVGKMRKDDAAHEYLTKLAAANQEIALLKGKLERMRKWVNSHSTHLVPYELDEICTILTPSPKEEKK